MSFQIKLSVKGQVVIPKDVRDALNLKPGETLNLKRVGNQVIMEAAGSARKKIDYSEFRSRMPKYHGSKVSIDDMNSKIHEIFENWEN
jgi:AbrB family looped-hinge helix DNA binding protein